MKKKNLKIQCKIRDIVQASRNVDIKHKEHIRNIKIQETNI